MTRPEVATGTVLGKDVGVLECSGADLRYAGIRRRRVMFAAGAKTS